ncbi:MAG: hypothetical protein QME79_04460 [Bacillota bacterium]|nr:hypothetical protein [Bacillota bacterium]
MSLVVWIVLLVVLVLIFLYLWVWRNTPEYAVLAPRPKAGETVPPEVPEPPAPSEAEVSEATGDQPGGSGGSR